MPRAESYQNRHTFLGGFGGEEIGMVFFVDGVTKTTLGPAAYS